jgi:hypothetical protein
MALSTGIEIVTINTSMPGYMSPVAAFIVWYRLKPQSTAQQILSAASDRV